MATGLEMFHALESAVKERRENSSSREPFTLSINRSDAKDLQKLAVDDLREIAFGDRAANVAAEIHLGKFDELEKLLNIRIEIDPRTLNLIPGEGMRRAAETLRDDPQTLEEMLLEMDQIRHPERYVS